MLVYGDQQFHSQLQPLRQQLGRLAQSCLAEPHNLEGLRSLLIACGQVEQAAHDALEGRLAPRAAAPWIACFHQATAHAAAAFYTAAWRQPQPLPPPRVGVNDALADLLATLHRLAGAPDLPVTVKLPEGFSFHALYPEQYLVAAGRWLAEHSGQQERGAVVAGIRSIGTTLAAVVATALRAGRWPVQPFTVRPSGHPFARQVNLEGMCLPPDAFGLVVDEGPGISGSSLAAAGAALAAAGLARANIAFFPGHANGPGGAGGEEVQRWWRTAPCYVADSTGITFDGQPLREALAAALPEPVVAWDNLSGGVWRQHVYGGVSEWPAICTAFERVKVCCTLTSGRRVLFKFLGLAALTPDLRSTAASAAVLLAGRAARGLAPPPLGTALGFVATEWVEGAPLTAGSTSPAMAARLGDYIARVAGPPLAGAELDAATARLAEVLVCNTQEALGDAAAERTRLLAAHAMQAIAAGQGGASYGDGHLQPYEWIARGSEPFKVDGVGHDCDHTLVGRQPVAWDIAGAIGEWRLDGAGVAQLLGAFRAAGGEEIAGDALRFYQVAYLALRAGQCSLAAQVHDPYERERLWAAYAVYREQLRNLLAEIGPPISASA